VRTPQWRVLTGGPACAAPFRVQLVCPSEAVRDALLAHLARHRIFAPVHWRQDRLGFFSGDDEAADLAARMLTVPVDHRCGPGDVRRVSEVLVAFVDRSARAGCLSPGMDGAPDRVGGRGGAELDTPLGRRHDDMSPPEYVRYTSHREEYQGRAV
jgi:hypothetical protein